MISSSPSAYCLRITFFKDFHAYCYGPSALSGAVWQASYTPTKPGSYAGFWVYSGGYERFTFEAVGTLLVSVGDIRSFEDVLSDRVKFPILALTRARDVVTEEFERITDRSFVVQGRTETVTASPWGHVPLTSFDVQSVTGVTYSGGTIDPAAYSLDASGGLSFDGLPVPSGTPLAVTYAYGFDRVPDDVKRAALLRVRDLLASASSGIPDRAVSFQVNDMGTYQLATAGRAGFETGLPDVDAIPSRYKMPFYAL
ncbi:hypothetical protein ACWCP8_12860 [Streptomyces sp. NPDC002206]